MSIKWGVLGTAGIAKGQTIPGMKQAENCELYAIAGRNEAKVKAYQDKFGFTRGYVGYDALLEDPEVQAVYIPLPNHIHKEWVIKALNAGKHVLCEKPLALNVSETKEMFDAARANNVYLMEAFAYLHSPYITALQDAISSGSIGDVEYIETGFVTQGYEPGSDIRVIKSAGGGAMYDLGCYCTSMILSLVDSDIDYVKAVGEFNDDGADLYDGVIIRFKNGVRASFDVGMIFNPGSDKRMDRLYVGGTKGYIKSAVEYNEEGELSFTVCTGDKCVTKTVTARQNYALEVEQLGRCIEIGETPHVSEAFSLKNAGLLDMLLEAIGY